MLEKKIRRYKIMDAHREMVRRGKYWQGWLLLQLLRKGNISVGLSDEGYEVECLLEKLGCPVRYGRNFNTAIFRI